MDSSQTDAPLSPAFGDSVQALKWSPVNNFVAAGGWDGTVSAALNCLRAFSLACLLLAAVGVRVSALCARPPRAAAPSHNWMRPGSARSACPTRRISYPKYTRPLAQACPQTQSAVSRAATTFQPPPPSFPLPPPPPSPAGTDLGGAADRPEPGQGRAEPRCAGAGRDVVVGWRARLLRAGRQHWQGLGPGLQHGRPVCRGECWQGIGRRTCLQCVSIHALYWERGGEGDQTRKFGPTNCRPTLTNSDQHPPHQHDAPIKVCRWVPSLNCVMTGGWDKQLKFWDGKSPQPLCALPTSG